MGTLRAGLSGLTAALLLAGCTAAQDPANPATDRSGASTVGLPTPSGPSVPTSSGPAVPTSSGPAVPTSSGPAVPTSSGPAVPTSSGPAVPTSSATTTAPNPVSIQALIAKTYDGRGLTLGRESGSTNAYRQYYATYRGGGLTISGRINIPRGTGPFPAVVLAHGYVDPAVYTNGQTMLRERDHLARQGYITLHIDYRNHAQSSKDPASGATMRLGYTEDAINAGLALQGFSLVDKDRLAIVGRSMGGGVVYNAMVVRPGLFKAAVAYAPVSSDAVDNFNRWLRNDREVASEIIARLGTPQADPRAWANASPRTFFDRITGPIMIHHGTADEDCPIQWSEETVAALKDSGKQVAYHVYPGQRHTFTSQWPLSIQRTAAFLDRYLA